MLKKISKIFIIILIVAGIFYAYLWYSSRKTYPVSFGISFSRGHSQFLGLDWKKNYLAMLDELKPKFIRISAAWNEIEPEADKFVTTDVDWQIAEAEKRGIKVTLAIGQKAPRWPECYVPSWANNFDEINYQKKVLDYIKFVVEKYKNSPSLEIWQVENEPYIRFAFGSCARYDKTLVKKEIELVKTLDMVHPTMITDSGELSTWSSSIKAGDIFGTTIYRIVMTPNGYYWNYDWLPAAYYRLKAEFWGRSMDSFYVSELQAEPWFTGTNPQNTPIAVQEKSMNPDRLIGHINYVEHIGVPRAYLWGVEWWYWLKETQKDNRYWNIVKEKLNKN